MSKQFRSKLVTVMEIITPLIAAKYLACNKENRSVRQQWVMTLAKLMRAGDFYLTHQGIAFNCDGTLKDGQHRLLAVIESGVSVQMMVTRGLSVEAMAGVDSGANRSVADLMGSMGLGLSVTTADVATARRMMEGHTYDSSARSTIPEIQRFVILHHEAIAFTAGRRGGVNVRNASLRAPVSRAWYTKDRDRLVDFMECLGTGLMKSSKDQAAITLRNAFLREPARYANGPGRVSLYRRTENALQAFIAGRPFSKIFEAPSELFPIPGDE